MKMTKLLSAVCILAAIAHTAKCAPQQNAKATAVQSSSAGSPGSGPPLTLRQAEALALKSNPQITVGKLKALIAEQAVRETRSALLPAAFMSLTAVDANPSSR